MPVVWSKWPWLSTITSTSCGESQAAHVLDQPVRGDAGVKQHPVLPTVLGDRHQCSEAVLGAQGIERLAALDHGGGHARRPGVDRRPDRGPSSSNRMSVTLSTSVVIVSDSTGSRPIVSNSVMTGTFFSRGR